MKKMFLTAALLVAGLSVMNAQTKEEMTESTARYEQLKKFVESKPQSTGESGVDEATEGVYSAAVHSVAITEQLQGLYKRQIGETVDGVADVTVKKPTLSELKDLSLTILSQAKTIGGLSSKVSGAIESATSIKNPLKAKKMLSSVNFLKNATPVLVKESELQVKAIGEMIKTAESANNL